jgi:hypothetical protein
MKLHVLLYGKSKKRMKPIMVDSKKKCENYEKARSNVTGFHSIEIAPPDAKKWKQKTSTVGGNKDLVPKINRHGKTSVNGWIGKNGFQPHT